MALEKTSPWRERLLAVLPLELGVEYSPCLRPAGLKIASFRGVGPHLKAAVPRAYKTDVLLHHISCQVAYSWHICVWTCKDAVNGSCTKERCGYQESGLLVANMFLYLTLIVVSELAHRPSSGVIKLKRFYQNWKHCTEMWLRYLSALASGPNTVPHVMISRALQSNDRSGDLAPRKRDSRHPAGGKANLTVRDGVLFQVLKSCSAMLPRDVRVYTVQRNGRSRLPIADGSTSFHRPASCFFRRSDRLISF